MKLTGSIWRRLVVVCVTFGILLLAGVTPVSAYYIPGSNVPPGPPPNYTTIDTTYFLGAPAIPDPPPDSGGYFIYRVDGTWSIVSHIYSKGKSLEQFHGSILVSMDQQPQLNVNVFTNMFELWSDSAASTCLDQNDRWGWVEWDTGLYEIWWDVTTRDFKNGQGDPNDLLEFRLVGCAFDFNLWSSAHRIQFQPDQIYLGANMTPLSTVPGFSDTYPGIEDIYQSQAGSDPTKDPNITTFASKALPGASYNKLGIITSTDSYSCEANYGSLYQGSFAYESNGIQFATACSPRENVPPILQVPSDSLVTWCSADSICFEVIGSDADLGDTVTLSLLEGPVSFTPVSGPGIVSVNVCFLADVDGQYRFIWQVEDLSGLIVVDTVTFSVTTGAGVSMPDQAFSGRVCNLRDNRILRLVTEPPDHQGSWFELISGSGSIDSVSGVLVYQPDTSGIHQFTVAVHNDCGSDTGLILDTLHLNTPGLIQPYDTIVYLCAQETICFDVYGHDVDGDSLLITQVEGLGEFTITSDSSGRTCFLPADVDSADYLFVYRAADSCDLCGGRGTPSLLEPQDSIRVTVIIDQAPAIICPDSVSFFTCDSDSFSFQIDAVDPEGGPVTFNLLSGNASIAGNTITVFGDQSMQFEVICEVVDTCGHTDTCAVPVEIIRNSPPIVHVNDGYDVNLCAAQTLCIGAGTFDPDNNIAGDSLSYGQYDPQSGQICFFADSSGSYEIILWAADSCGLEHADTSIVTAHINQPPTVDLGPDFATTVCAGSQVCFGIDVVDEQSPFVSIDGGGAYYDPGTSQVCFSPDSAGVYRLIATVRDDCGEVDYDTVEVTVVYLAQPTVNILGGSEQFVCNVIDSVCLDVSVVASGQYTVSSNIGTYDAESGQVCFVPDTAGSFDLVVVVTDSCGFEATDSMVVTVSVNSPPTVSGFSDSSVYLCSPREVCLPVSIADVDSNIDEVAVSRGQYIDGRVCFVPYSQGAYEIVLTATDSCGQTAVDTALVTVLTDQNVSLECPADTTVFACGIDDIFSFPIGGIPLGAQVSVSGINVWWDAPSQSVQFSAECANINNITVTATTECGSYSCQFAVTVNCNQRPVVLFPPDTGIFLCEPSEVCIPLGITDVDGNFDSLIVEGGMFDPVSSDICFQVDTGGLYLIKVTAIDSCGAVELDSVFVSVEINQAPVTYVPNDTTIFQCAAVEVALPVSATDIDGNLTDFQLTGGPGSLVDGHWVYTPVGDEIVTVTVRGTDECLAISEQSFTVGFVMNSVPVGTVPSDTSFFQCDPQQVSLPYSVTDDDGNLTDVSILSGPGELVDGFWVYSPVNDTTLTITIGAVDGCEASWQDSFTVSVGINEAPMCTVPNDTTFFMCNPFEVSLPFSSTDGDGNLAQTIITSGPGQLIEGNWVYTPTDDEIVEVVIEATDECGAFCIDSFTIDFGVNDAPVCELPNDTTFALCDLSEVSLPVSATDEDGNLASCFVISGPGEIVDGMWLYTPVGDEAVTVVVGCFDSCEVSCQGSFRVVFDINEAPVCNLPSDSSIFQCEIGPVSLPYSISDAENNVTEVLITDGPGELIEGSWVYTPSGDETVSVTIEATDVCGLTCSGSFDVQFDINEAPTCSLAADTSIFLCEIAQVSLPYWSDDADGNLVGTAIISGPGALADGRWLYTPQADESRMIIIRATDECGVYCDDTLNVNFRINDAPVCSLPGDTTFVQCVPEEVSLWVGSIDEWGNLQDCQLIESPGAIVDGQWIYTPSGSESFAVTVRCTDSCGAFCEGTFQVTFDVNQLPVIEDQFGSARVCLSGESREFTMVAFDPDADLLTYELLSGPGSIDQSGLVSYIPDTAGVYSFQIAVSDECAGDTAFFLDTVLVNSFPQVVPFSDTVYLCDPQDICFEVYATDPDGDVMTITQVAGPGQLEMISDSSGTTCFTPSVEDSVTYLFAYCVSDDCQSYRDGRVIGGPGCIPDTVRITIIYDQPPVLLPEPQSFFACGGDTLSFALDSFDPEGGPIADTVISGNAWAVGNLIYMEAAAGGQFDVVVIATDSCGHSDTAAVPVTITMNSAPTVSGLSDSSVYLCSPREVCLPVSIADVDNNIAEVTVSRGQYIDGLVCFVPYSQGAYEIVLTATDSCGRTAVDTALVTVLTDQGVAIECPNDTTVFACGIDDIFSFPIGGIPSGAQVSVSGINVWWDAPSQSVQFSAECANINSITVTATTECGSYSCQFAVTVNCNQHPLVLLPGDTAIILCAPGQLCIPVGVSDVDGNLDSVYSSLGSYSAAHGTVCFVADSTGVYQIEVTAVDSCGLASTDVVDVSVVINSAPQITFGPTDTLFSQCLPEQICLPLVIDDAEGNIVSITAGAGFEYSASDSTVCFFPDQWGQYCATVVALDSCGLVDTASLCVTVEEGDYVQFNCPSQIFIADSLCRADSICVPLDITGDNVVVTAAYGFYDSGSLCFFADTTGLYSFEVIATAQCNADTCLVEVEVFVADSVEISCVGDTTEFLCGPATLCYPFVASSSVQSVSVELPAYISGDSVCLPVDASGSYQIVLTADGGECGIATCTFTVDATINSSPAISIQGSYTATVCSLDAVCIPVTVSDIDGNVDSLFSSSGEIVFGEDTSLCFTPTFYDTVYIVEVGVRDNCGELAFDTVSVSLHQGASAFILCPADTRYETICGATNVCILAPITPFEAIVTVSHGGYYDPDSGLVCVSVDSAGTYDIVVIAEATCSTDTCQITLIVDEAEGPSVDSPARIDTVLCLNGTDDTLCFAVDVIGSGVEVNVNPIGYYSAGFVCLPVDTAGSYELEIIAFGICGSDTGYTTVFVVANDAPQLSLPSDTIILRCPADTGLICIDGIFADDDATIVSPTMVCGSGSFELISVDSGRVCFQPVPGDFGVQEFCFVTSDSCQSDSSSFFVDIQEKTDCDVCVRVTIDGGASTPVGVAKSVDINVETNDGIGGFDLLVGYDASVVAFQAATTEGTAIDGWEYFTYRIDDYGCGSACPSGIVRLIGIADINNGIPHPPDSTLTPNGRLVRMQYLVANDQNLGDQFLPIRLVWFDCGDNAFSDISGNLLFVESRIFSAEGSLVWDELDDVAYPDSARPFMMGAPDSCIGQGGKADPVRCVEFYNGGIHVVHPDSIDARGDINLNGISYEIADAVVFSNYFIYGLAAFTVNVQGQIAATDVNADGITLSVADLIHLIRVVTGDVGGSPRVDPYSDELTVEVEAAAGRTNLLTESESDIGGALFVFDITGDVLVQTVRLAGETKQMSLLWGVVDGQLRLLLYSLERGRVEPGRNNLVEISFSGSGEVVLASSEVVDYYGRPYHTANRARLLPDQFSLAQNYPNPFNPSTNISFSLPTATSWSLTIYNVTGALVRQYSGSDEAGKVNLAWDGRNVQNSMVASGIYFYRLQAGDFSDTKKMVLLK